VKETKKKLPIIIIGIVCICIGMVGEVLQGLAGNGIIEYKWYMGHISDFMIIPISYIMYQLLGLRNVSWWLVALLQTIAEIISLDTVLTGHKNTFDVWDIATFWLASIVCWYVERTIKKKRSNSTSSFSYSENSAYITVLTKSSL